LVEEEFSKVGRSSRGQKQRQVGIWVLQATAMPSVLVETGYITNREEEDYLNSENGQQEIAECVTNALRNYISWLEKNQTQVSGTVPNKFNTQKSYAFLKNIEEQERHRMVVKSK
jgi:N-acetylmuramoyl-L-alanine amidase